MCKTGHLELRPVHVRTEASTRGHVFVVMMAYMVRRRLAKAWQDIDMTVEEGLAALNTLCCMEMKAPKHESTHSIPKPSNVVKELLDALEIKMPKVLTQRTVNVGTKKKLTKRLS